ncbi:MAG: hypothetical protein MUE68_05090 [Bacteroidetes bacterium]|nr:hypothetical protein [Bacteroidota bacterium]
MRLPGSSFLLFLFVALAAPSVSQHSVLPDSLRAIADEIGALPGSDLHLLGKARGLLGRSILTGDIEKTGRVLQYLDALFDSSRIIVLQPRERLLAEFWAGKFERVLADPERAAELTWESDPGAMPYRRPRLTPDRDLLLEDLVDHAREHRAELIARVVSSPLGVEQRDFLRLFVAVLIGPEPAASDGHAAYRRQLNDEANEFLAMYPRSTYETFVRRYMRVVLRPSPWAYALGVGMGGMRFEGELSRWLTSGLSFDLWGEVSYRQWYVMLWTTLGSLSEVRSTFVYHDTWFTGTAVSPSGAALAVGYTFHLSRSIIVTPHVGWAYVDISPPEQERTKTGFDGKIDLGAGVAGVNVDLPIFRTDEGERLDGLERGYHMLRARVAVMPTSTHIPYAKGTIVSFTLSYGLFGRSVERDL